MELVFSEAKTDREIKDIYDHTIDAFSDSPDFKWTVQEIKKEVKEGWQLYSISLEDEIIAAIFFKIEGKTLSTKNTAVKMTHSGSGYSHTIKEFFEDKAREMKLDKIKHYCRIDNFRMYSLNEKHGYRKTADKLGKDGQIVEWTRDLKKKFERKKDRT